MTIYAIAIATNFQRTQSFKLATEHLQQWGSCKFSSIYEIPCRDQVGADYWNGACLLNSNVELLSLQQSLTQLEQLAERKRPSHQISLDVDLIAWGQDLAEMQFNPKKIPLVEDVIIPLQEIWTEIRSTHLAHHYPCLSFSILKNLPF